MVISKEGKRRLKAFIIINSSLIFLIFSFMYLLNSHDSYDTFREIYEDNPRYYNQDGTHEYNFEDKETVRTKRIMAQIMLNVWITLMVAYNILMLIRVMMHNGEK